MKKLIALIGLLLAETLAFAQTFPVQNLQVNGTSSFGGAMSGSGLVAHDAAVSRVQTLTNVAALRARRACPG